MGIKISELNPLETPADGDIIPIVDMDAGETKYIEFADLLGPEGPAGPAGADGEEVTIRVDGGYIQWRLGDGEWENLIAVSSLVGPQGEQGIQGPAGPAATLNWMGAWSALTEYDPLDVVSHEGVTYICIATSTDDEPPDPVHWNAIGAGVGASPRSVLVEVPYNAADEVIYDDTPGLKFDGLDDYVACHADTDLSGDALTVAMTVTLFSLPTGLDDKFLFDNSLSSGNDGSFAIRLSGSYSGAIQTTFIKAGAVMSQEWGVPSLNTPLKIIMTFDKVADEVYVYVDNVVGGAVWKPGLASLVKYPVNLARRISTNISYTDCIFHDLHVWKRVITSDERANYQDGAAISNTNLVISYAFDEESGATLDDASTEENDGTLINFADTTLGAGVVGESGWVVPTNAKPLLTMPANGFVRFVGKVVATAYDDGSVTVGEDSDKDSLMTAVLVDAQGTTNDTYTPNKYYASGAVIKAFITPGSATEGTFTLILEYVTV